MSKEMQQEAEKKPKPTRRPWEIFEGGNFVRIGAQGYVKWTENHNYLGGPLSVADMAYSATDNYEQDHEKALANAELIVRAVNTHDALVKALIASLHAMRSYQYGNAEAALADEIEALGLAALAAAKE